MTQLTPLPEHRFTFGLWTVGNPGRDPFGDVTRPARDPAESVRRLGELGAYGISFHEDDVVPPGSSAGERDAATRRLKRALEETGLVVAMAGSNLYWDPLFKDGAFTASDPAVRRHALAKTMRAIDFAADFGARTYVIWGGREGVEAPAAKAPRDALERLRETIDFLCAFVRDRGYDLRFALEPKPNEPRGDLFLPTVGHALAFIERLEHPEMVGVNPEMAHETMAGLSFHHGVAQALWAGKLFHVDLNAQKIGRFDQDLRFGAEDLKEAFFVVRLLEESGYDGPRHFDARPLRTENEEGVWAFAAGCMHTYLALAGKARAFAADREIQDALAAAGAPALAEPAFGPYDPEAARSLLAAAPFAPGPDVGYHNDRLDQLTVDLLLGLR